MSKLKTTPKSIKTKSGSKKSPTGDMTKKQSTVRKYCKADKG
jgi:hypothetical protein